jgi:hypothetical protein
MHALHVIHDEEGEESSLEASVQPTRRAGMAHARLFSAMGLVLRCQCDLNRERTPRRSSCAIHGPGAQH